jgi:phosphatidylglycerol---prolipoprotein diacylglyceryl transferase
VFEIAYPAIDPALITIGPFSIRWYALAYIAALLLGWRYCLYLGRRWAERGTAVAPPRAFDDFLVWATIAIVLGGRLGYVLFYNFAYYVVEPSQIVALWHGGMSFHGGIAGVCIAIVLFCRRRQLPLMRFGDAIACAAPIGLFLGRIANFINGELWGRPSGVPWAMVFPNAPYVNGRPVPRHPSQVYEAFLEGIVLFALTFALQRSDAVRARPGTISGAFLLCYGLFRIFAELFREPDQQLGFLFAGVTMGQILSLPLIAGGLYLLARDRREAAAT